LRKRLGPSVVMLATPTPDGPKFVALAAPEATQRGIHAGNILRKVAAVASGSGGGRPEMAQGGGRDPSKLGEALELARELINEGLA
jgi:alanyl-tRNA synthetase